MSKRGIGLFLDDMLEAIQKVERYIELKLGVSRLIDWGLGIGDWGKDDDGILLGGMVRVSFVYDDA